MSELYVALNSALIVGLAVAILFAAAAGASLLFAWLNAGRSR